MNTPKYLEIAELIRIWKKVCKAFAECSSKTGLF